MGAKFKTDASFWPLDGELAMASHWVTFDYFGFGYNAVYPLVQTYCGMIKLDHIAVGGIFVRVFSEDNLGLGAEIVRDIGSL